jgi:hypothetical protein
VDWSDPESVIGYLVDYWQVLAGGERPFDEAAFRALARRDVERASDLQGRATAIFAVMVTFNEFLVALVLTSTPDAETVPRGVSTLVGRIDTDWAAMSAGGVLAALPIVVFALLVQRHLVRGLTLGAVR